MLMGKCFEENAFDSLLEDNDESEEDIEVLSQIQNPESPKLDLVPSTYSPRKYIVGFENESFDWTDALAEHSPRPPSPKKKEIVEESKDLMEIFSQPAKKVFLEDTKCQGFTFGLSIFGRFKVIRVIGKKM